MTTTPSDPVTPEQAVQDAAPARTRTPPLQPFMQEIASLVLYPKIAKILRVGVVNKTDLHKKFCDSTGSSVSFGTFWEWVTLCNLATVFDRPLFQLPTSVSGNTLPTPPAIPGEPVEITDFRPGANTQPSTPGTPTQGSLNFPPDPYQLRDENGSPMILT